MDDATTLDGAASNASFGAQAATSGAVSTLKAGGTFSLDRVGGLRLGSELRLPLRAGGRGFFGVANNNKQKPGAKAAPTATVAPASDQLADNGDQIGTGGFKPFGQVCTAGHPARPPGTPVGWD